MSAPWLKKHLPVIFYAFWERLPMILCCCQREMRQPRAAAPLLGESWGVPCLIPPSCTMPRKPGLRNRSFGSSWGQAAEPPPSPRLSMNVVMPQLQSPRAGGAGHAAGPRGALGQPPVPAQLRASTPHTLHPPSAAALTAAPQLGETAKKQPGMGRDRGDPRGCAARETLVAGLSRCDCYSPTYTPG